MKITVKYIILTLILVSVVYPSFYLKQKKKETNSYISINQKLTNDQSVFENSKIIDDQVDNFIQKNNLTGVSVSIIDQDRLVYSKGYGFADKAKNIKTAPGSLFRLASVSKLVTAVAIMKLVEEKKISLYSKVFGKEGIINDEKFLEIADPRLCDITILNLLNHSGGWTQRYGDPAFDPLAISKLINEEPPATIDTYIKFVTSRKLHFTPGSRFSYSNVGYMFLGEVIKKVTGMSYEEYVLKDVLFPMGIYDMHLARNLYEERFPNEVAYYTPKHDSLVYSYKGDSTLVSKVYGGNDIRLLGSAGGWVASSPELAILMASIDNKKDMRDFLSEESIELMTGKLDKYLGWKQEYENGWLRTGSFAGTAAVMYKGPEGLDWVFLSNTSSWKGPTFSHDIFRLMKKITKSVPAWPQRDLFTNFDNASSTRNLPI